MKKRVFVLILAGLMAISVAGCAGDTTISTQPPTPDPTEKIETIPEPTPTEKSEIHWGDSISEVSNKETSELLDSSEEQLLYKIDIHGEQGKIIYKFDKNEGLYNTYAVIEVDLDNADAGFSIQEDMKSILTALYGEPETDKVISTNPALPIEGDGHDETLNGDAFLSTEWNNQNIHAAVFVASTDSSMLISIEVEAIRDPISTPPIEQETFSIGDTVNMGDWEVSITGLSFTSEIFFSTYLYYKPESGNRYAVVSAVVTNNGKEAGEFLSFYGSGISAKLIYSDGYEYPALRLLSYDDDIYGSVLNPLTSKDGVIVFEVPSVVEESDEPIIVNFYSSDQVVGFSLR